MGAVFFTIVQIFVACIIPYLIYRSFSFKGADVFDMLGAQSFCKYGICIHSFTGSVRWCRRQLLFVLWNIFGDKLIIPALFIWRVVTYYLNIVGGIAFVFIVKRIPQRTLYREKTKAELEADRQSKELTSQRLDL